MQARYLALLEPISAQHPCGADLEYHPDMLVLNSRTEYREAAQYGDFVAPSESVNWRETETDVMRLLSHGRDLRALALLLRCRIHLAGAQGAHEGLGLIAALLDRHPQAIHPQHVIDGDNDLAVRANALSLLVEPSVLNALREVLVDSASATRLSVRDVEKSFATPRASDAFEPESVQRHLRALLDKRDDTLALLAHAHRAAVGIATFAEKDLGPEAPDLSALLNLLQPFSIGESLLPNAPEALLPRLKATLSRWLHTEPHTTPAEPVDDTPAPSLAPATNTATHGAAVAHYDMPSPIAHPSTHSTMLPDRDAVKAQIQSARRWFEAFEPSSPVADLLKQAERMIGKPYIDIADVIPIDLLKAWRQQDD